MKSTKVLPLLLAAAVGCSEAQSNEPKDKYGGKGVNITLPNGATCTGVPEKTSLKDFWSYDTTIEDKSYLECTVTHIGFPQERELTTSLNNIMGGPGFVGGDASQDEIDGIIIRAQPTDSTIAERICYVTEGRVPPVVLLDDFNTGDTVLLPTTIVTGNDHADRVYYKTKARRDSYEAHRVLKPEDLAL